jgi:hypothetical protein
LKRPSELPNAVGDHRAREHDRLAVTPSAMCTGRLDHGVGAVGDHDLVSHRNSRHARTIMRALASVIVELSTIMSVSTSTSEPASSAPQHLVDVRVPEIELAAQLVVFLCRRCRR